MRMRIISVILLLVALLAWPMLARAQDGATLAIEKAIGRPNSTAELNVSMTNADDVGGLDLALRYDPGVARFSEARVGATAENALMEANEIEPGLLLVALADSDGLSGDGSVVIIKFDVVGSEGDATTVAVEGARAYHHDTLIDIPVTTIAGELTVASKGLPSLALIGGAALLALMVVIVVVLLLRRRRPS